MALTLGSTPQSKPALTGLHGALRGYPKRSFSDRTRSAEGTRGEGADEGGPIDEPAQKFLLILKNRKDPRTDARECSVDVE